jgi:hypothetical protein
MPMMQFCTIGTDANVGVPTALARYLYAPRADNIALEQSANWDEKTYLEKAEGNRKTETTGVYSEVIAGMGIKRLVCIRDVVGSELCISSSSGQKVFDNLLSAISQGNNVCISFENIKSLSPSFLDSAIGQLYNIKDHKYVDEKLSFENISPGRKLIVDEAIREAKEYYSDPEKYLAKRKESFADD